MKDRINEIRLRRWLAEIEGDLADDARSFLNENEIYSKNANMEESQINNLIQHSEQTRSFESVKSFIRYQISRSKEGEQWKFADNTSQPFGELLISKLEEFCNKYWEIENLAKETGYEESEIFWNIMQRYLGYIKWYFVHEKR